MRVLILGGTSGIGWALARHYLARGDVVAACGRDVTRIDLSSLPQGAQLHTYQVDIADKAQLSQVIDEFARDGLDLLVVTAGLYFNTRHHQIDAATTMRMLTTNVSGLSQAFELASRKMLRQQSGHLVAVASVAGLLQDYPGASLYSATKRTVLNLCDTYRIAMKPFSIAVTAVVPGYVDTAKLRALNGGDVSHKPFLLTEEKAVALIVRAIDKRQPQLVIPWQMRWLIALLNRLPPVVLRLRRG